MKITNLKLIDFRSYENVDVDFSSNINIIYGNNGVGKTNLIEGIYLLALTKSFRTNNDKFLIKKDAIQTQVKGEITNNKSSSTYKVIISNDGKKVEVDNNKVDKFSNYVSRITIIIYYPHDNELLLAAPEIRRKMLNIEISQLFKEYMKVLANYNNILKQRNAYLKQLLVYGNASHDYLDILTKKLIELGKNIYKYRRDYIDKINLYINDIYKSIFKDGDLSINYKSEYQKKDSEILGYYRKNYSREMALGKTLFGPHHDDIEFLLDGNKMKDWASQGQMKNAILSFKLAEINIIKEIKGEYPIMLLDDLFSELDKTKVNNILNLLDDNVQTFITTTDIDKIPKSIIDKSSIFKVLPNNIEEVKNE